MKNFVRFVHYYVKSSVTRSVLKYAVPSEDVLGGWRFATPHLVHVLDVRRKMGGSNVARPVRRSRDMVFQHALRIFTPGKESH